VVPPTVPSPPENKSMRAACSLVTNLSAVAFSAGTTLCIRGRLRKIASKRLGEEK
jgi:hypothetical protein